LSMILSENRFPLFGIMLSLSAGCCPLARGQYVATVIGLGDEHAAGNAALRVDLFPRRVEHRHMRADHPKTLGDVKAARRAGEIDVGEDDVE